MRTTYRSQKHLQLIENLGGQRMHATPGPKFIHFHAAFGKKMVE